MAASQTDIANFSLSHLGVGKRIANIDTEKSEEANVARLFFETARDATLRDFPWPFACKIASLALVENDPTTEVAFAYQVPGDSVKLRRILSGITPDTRQTRVPYRVIGSLIHTDADEAVMEYTERIKDEGRFPADFVLALSYRLATYMAPDLTRGDPFKLAERAFDAYEIEIGRASENAINEEQEPEEVLSEFTRTREGPGLRIGQRQSFIDLFGS